MHGGCNQKQTITVALDGRSSSSPPLAFLPAFLAFVAPSLVPLEASCTSPPVRAAALSAFLPWLATTVRGARTENPTLLDALFVVLT